MENKPIKCARCGAELEESNVRKQVIRYRMNRKLQKKEMTFCADKPCGGHYQMAMEG